MKILYFNPEDESFMTRWQQFQIFDELKHYDINIEVFNPWSYTNYDEANEYLLMRIKEDRDFDLFMSCAPSEMLFESTMRIINCISVPKLLICFDNLHAPYLHKAIAPLFDLVWLTSWETEPMFKKWGCKTIFLPYASNPFAFKDLYNKNIEKVCFVGTPYGTRTMMFNSLTKNKINVDVFCKSNEIAEQAMNNHTEFTRKFCSTTKMIVELLSFPIGRSVLYSRLKKSLICTPELEESEFLSFKNKLSNYEMNMAYSNYALSLNIITLRNTATLKHPIHKLHLRTFEIPMCGGLELVEYNDELAKYFSDQELVFYKNDEEMVDKARFYTNPRNDAINRKMKIMARERAVQEHSWINRFSMIFDTLGLKCNYRPLIG